MDEDEAALRAEVEQRLARPFERVQAQLLELFGKQWEEIEISIATSAVKKDRSEADVIIDLVAKAEARENQPMTQKARRAVINWIGKPWRERENPWDKHKDRVRDLRTPPPTTGEGEPWRPLRPDE